MTVYLLHLQQPLNRGISPAGKLLQAAHYIGYTGKDDLSDRMAEHMTGRGARILQVAFERNISFQIARIWKGPRATRGFERRLKNRKHGPKLCPVCNPNALNLAQL